MNKIFGEIHHYQLDNGLRVIINPDQTVPKVSAQLWYAVGSKDEQAGEKGLAHLLEHMIFKGTQRLSESDINLITSKLSGSTNAFTSYDYTGYLFDFPKQHWTAALDMFADCMINCSFDEDMLQSELKAVIQELKLYKDDYAASLVEEMVAHMFPDHPYHHPIIGYKQDLWSITRDGLMRFYKKHYRPDNATLVIVGAIDIQQAMKDVEAYFGGIKTETSYERSKYVSLLDFQSTSVTLYRDVQRPMLVYAWRVPGLSKQQDFVMSVLAYMIGESKSSILYERLVDELGLATDVHMSFDDMFDHGVLFLQVDPIDDEAIGQIEKEIIRVIEQLQQQTYCDDQILSAIKQSRTEFLLQGEELQDRAYMIGKGYLATGDAEYINKCTQLDFTLVKEDVARIIQDSLRVAFMHKGAVLPLPESEKKHWLEIQQESDRTDAIILSRKVRQTEVEQGKYVHTLTQKEPVPFEITEHGSYVLSNGLCILYHTRDRDQKIEIQIDFEAHYYHDPEHLQGLSAYMFAVMQEGTKSFSKSAFMQALASRGMHLDVRTGYVSLTLLKEDLVYGLNLLFELFEHALFDHHAIEKVRKQLLSDIDDYWDTPSQFVQQLVREHIYQNHPYAKRYFGTKESIARITRDDLIACYASQVTPTNARLAIVGNIEGDVASIFEKGLGSWKGKQLCPLVFPVIVTPKQQEIIHPITRDQVVLAFAGLSVDRSNKLYDPLLLFDQIFTGGAQTSMSSHLFQLREQTGLFYTIGGSLVYSADKQPGMIYIKTIVSQDRLAEAEAAIKNTMYTSAQRITSEDIRMAKDALAYQLVDQFATQKGIAQSMLFIERMQLPKDYYKKRMEVLRSIEKQQVVDAAQQMLQPGNISTFKVGRV